MTRAVGEPSPARSSPFQNAKLRPPTAHPSLFFSRAGLPGLREKAHTTHRHIWQKMREQLESAVELGPEDLVYDGETADGDEALWIRDIARFAAAYAFGFVICEDRRYFELAKRCIEYLLFDPRPGEWGEQPKRSNKELAAADAYLGIALFWDWCHGALSSNERERIRREVLRRADEMYRACASNGYAEPGWFRNIYRGWMNGHSTANRCGLGVLALAMRGESFDGVERTSDSTFDDWIAEAAWGHTQNLIRWPPDGSWPEGIGYGCHPVWYALTFAHAYSFAGGEDLTLKNREFLTNLMYFRLYHGLDPDGAGGQGTIFSYGDSPNHDWHDPGALMFRVASLSRDGVLQAYANELFRHGWEQRWHGHWWRYHGRIAGWFHFLWHDPDLKPDARGLAALPRARAWRNIGVAVARDGWGADCTALHFKCGPPAGHAADSVGHAHADQGQLNLYALGEYLLVDTGGYYVGETKYHNTILVDGQGQIANERGINWKNAGLYAALNPKPDVALFDDAGPVVRMAGTFHTTYPPELGVIRARREVAYLRSAAPGGESFVAVCDGLEAESPRRFQALWHISGRAAVRGARIEARGARGKAELSLEAFSEAALATEASEGTWNRSGGWTRTITNGLDVAIGPQSPQERLRMVTLLHVRPAGRPGARMYAIEGEEVVGAAARSGAETTAFIFSRAPERPPETLAYTLPAAPETLHLVGGVAPGRHYRARGTIKGGRLAVRIVPEGELCATERGTLLFKMNERGKALPAIGERGEP